MVKEELAGTAKMLAPPGFTGQIPFLSLGSDVGRRVTVFQGESKFTGPYVVEDVDVEGTTHRRLVFLDNQFLVQSEARMKTVKIKNKTRSVIDYGHISLYHSFMCVGVQLAIARPHKVAILGLGGGSLAMFLRKCFEATQVVAVDIDPAILELAKQHFELKLDSNLDVRIEDGLDFLKNAAESGTPYSCVLFDMDSKQRALGLACPPPQFLSDAALADVTAVVGHAGQFILNLVCRDKQLHSSTMATLKRHFKHLVSVKLCEEVNEIIFATNGMAYNIDKLEATVKELNAAARDRNLVRVKCVDLKDFLQSITIIS